VLLVEYTSSDTAVRKRMQKAEFPVTVFLHFI